MIRWRVALLWFWGLLTGAFLCDLSGHLQQGVAVSPLRVGSLVVAVGASILNFLVLVRPR